MNNYLLNWDGTKRYAAQGAIENSGPQSTWRGGYTQGTCLRGHGSHIATQFLLTAGALFGNSHVLLSIESIDKPPIIYKPPIYSSFY